WRPFAVSEASREKSAAASTWSPTLRSTSPESRAGCTTYAALLSSSEATAPIHHEHRQAGAEQNHSARLRRGRLKSDRGHRIDFARPIGRAYARTDERVLYLRVHPGRK